MGKPSWQNPKTDPFLLKWCAIKEEIASCSQCIGIWPQDVVRPLGIQEIPNPPSEIKILFVGVAPTPEESRNHGTHFYSSSRDNLRVGLFKVLEAKVEIQLIGLSCEDGNQAFHQLGFFFVHCAKVRPIQDSAPPLDAIRFCSQKHLKAEILLLRPRVICFLGSNNTRDAAKELFGLHLGPTPTLVTLESWSGLVAVAHQPIRGHETQTKNVFIQLMESIA